MFNNKKDMIVARTGQLPTVCFGTSIWDETLYRAWSSIVYSLIPNMQDLEKHLNNFCSICNADEVVLFERATFLVISHATHTEHRDIHRFEKISNIIKQFKLSCSKSQAQFQGMEVRNSNFTAFIDFFTANTYIMVIMSDQNIRTYLHCCCPPSPPPLRLRRSTSCRSGAKLVTGCMCVLICGPMSRTGDDPPEHQGRPTSLRGACAADWMRLANKGQSDLVLTRYNRRGHITPTSSVLQSNMGP